MFNIYNTPQEKSLVNLLTPLLEQYSCEIVRVRFFGNKFNKKCQVMIDKTDSNTRVGIKDCELVNSIILQLMKSKSIELKDYIIEVSSPGINKPLTRMNDFINSKGKCIKIHTSCKVLNKRNFKGILKNVTNDSISIELLVDKSVIDIQLNMVQSIHLQCETHTY